MHAIPLLKGFKDFLLRGNVVDLAVAVVVGLSPYATLRHCLEEGWPVMTGTVR